MMGAYIFLKQNHACVYDQVVCTGHTQECCLKSLQLPLLLVASVQLRNNLRKKKESQNIPEFCTGISKMQNQSLEVFALQTECSLNIEHVIKSYAWISCLDFSVFRQDLAC